MGARFGGLLFYEVAWRLGGMLLDFRDVGWISHGLATNGAGTPESTAQLIREMQTHRQALARELDIQPQ
jgi:hypothetical protein